MATLAGVGLVSGITMSIRGNVESVDRPEFLAALVSELQARLSGPSQDLIPGSGMPVEPQ